MTTLDGKTPDIAAENIEKLKNIFPDIFEEGKIDFSKLKQDLGEYVDDEKERYNFSWNGKGRALRLSQTPSAGTLRPCPEESKNWDNTKNLYIEGDNLEVLKLLQKSYHGKVKMIYIDPPYNTGNDFVYPDNFADSIENYKEITGQVDSEGHNYGNNSETNGHYHTDWLNMMYPRLRLARSLLSDDGVIFISIDDNELANLKKACDEIFGEMNFESCITWRRRSNQPNDKSKMIAKVAENILVYAKDSNYLSTNRGFYGVPISDTRKAEYTNPDNDARGPWSTNPWKAAVGRGGTNYSITTPSGIVYTETWYGSKETFDALLKDNRVYWTDGGNGFPRIKIFLSDAEKTGQAATNFFTNDRFGSNQEGSAEVEKLFRIKGIFDNPKPMRLIKSLLQLSTNDCSILLDFFSGTATAAHAAMQLNAEDGGSRRFIMVQLPEPCPEGSEAAKAGYKNICEIGKERIRRAGEKIKTEVEEQNTQLKLDEKPKKVPDIGFQVFKLDSSNLKKWNTEAGMTADYVDGSEQLNFSEKKLAEDLQAAVENYIPGRTEQDVVYEILLKMGFDLTWPVEEKVIAGKKVYVVALGALMLCLENNITPDVARGMAELHKQLAPETWKVVFRDNGFASDSDKVNVHEILKSAGLEEDAFTTV